MMITLTNNQQHSNNGFLDYGSLISAGQQTSMPVVVALKDLASRLRNASGVGTPSDLTPPTSGGDQPMSRSMSQSGALKTTREPGVAIGSGQFDRQLSPNTFYNAQTRKGSSLTSSSYSDSLQDADTYQSSSNMSENQRFREHESRPLRVMNFSTQSYATNGATLLGEEPESKDRPTSSIPYKPRNQSAASQPHTISSIQEEISDFDAGSIMSSLSQHYSTRHFDSRNNSTSDDGGQHHHLYGSSWKSSIITTPDTLPSPISPGFHSHNQSDQTYSLNTINTKEAMMKDPSRETRMDRTKKHDSADAVSPHSQLRLRQNTDNFGPPPAPPPVRRLPEPPRPIKVSLFPAPLRRDLNRDTGTLSFHDSSKAEDRGGTESQPPIPVASAFLPTKQPVSISSPPETSFMMPPKIGTHGVKYTPILAAEPPHRTINRPVGSAPIIQPSIRYPEPTLPILPPESQAPLVKAVEAHWINSKEMLPYPPPVKGSAPKETIVDGRGPRRDSKISLAQTASSEGTMTQEKWLCLTRSVKQIPGFPTAHVEYIPSINASTRPADNLPNESNKFWTLCKNAVAMQTNDGKKSPEEVANRPAGITGNEKYMKCRKCKYEYSAYSKSGKGAMTDSRWKDGPNGLMYRETILFKSHVTAKKDKLPQEEYRFGCIFCAANGNGMPIFKGKTSFLHHLLEHSSGNYPSEVLKTRIKFIQKSEYKINPQEDYYELALP